MGVGTAESKATVKSNAVGTAESKTVNIDGNKVRESRGRWMDLAVIGGGPAGLAAAWSAKRSGVETITVFERNEYPGGILPQCIHNGFGIGIYGKDHTGPEYAAIWNRHMQEEQIEVLCKTTVLQVERNEDGTFELRCLGPQIGLQTWTAGAVIFACGCRERTLGQMRIPGSRPAGIYMAGSAQYMVNISNLKPGKNVVIMGFGDIGLIMARRLMLEGIHVRMIFGEQANGLVRNYIQCVREFGIESKAGYTLVSTHGYKRLKGVTIAPKTEEGEVLLEQKEYIPCDTLLVAAGLVPEDELFQELAGEHMQADDQGVTQIPGIFACGNVTEISDLVDKVTMAGIYAGNSAAAYLGRTVISMEELFAGDAGKARQAFAYHPTKMNGQIPEPTQFVCTICPNGCVIQKEGDHYTGHKCERGAAFARDYAESGVLKTILTTTVKVAGGQKKLLAVRTDTALSRQEMEALMPTLQKMTVTAPIEEGTVIMTSDLNIVNIVATETIYVNE